MLPMSIPSHPSSSAAETPTLSIPPADTPPRLYFTPCTVGGGVETFITKYLQPAYPCSSSSSLLSWARSGSAGLQTRQVAPTSLQHDSQYEALQSGLGQGWCRGVSGVPHKVQLWRKQRRSQGHRRRHHCSSNVPCDEDGPV